MSRLANLFRSLFGSSSAGDPTHPGTSATLNGNDAVAITEAAISQVTALGGPAQDQTLMLAWEAAAKEQHGLNLLGEPLGAVGTPGARGALAAAMGATLGGARSTAFLLGDDLAG
ncbi:MAG: hypothetical protein HN348_09850, partial [Proteobacteria bacterium]|nr:hypothetical protein [Pseudomonadota bacterium]